MNDKPRSNGHVFSMCQYEGEFGTVQVTRVEFTRQLERELSAMTAERDSLRTEVEGLRKDAGRMDWIERMHTLHKAVEFLYVVDGYSCTITHDGNPVATFADDTIRTAIDAAIQGEVTKP